MPFCKLNIGKSKDCWLTLLLAETNYTKRRIPKYFNSFHSLCVHLWLYLVANLLFIQVSNSAKPSVYCSLSRKHSSKSLHDPPLLTQTTYSFFGLRLSTFPPLLLTRHHLNVLPLNVNLVPPSPSRPHWDSERVEYPWGDLVLDGTHGYRRRYSTGPDRVDACIGSSHEYSV